MFVRGTPLDLSSFLFLTPFPLYSHSLFSFATYLLVVLVVTVTVVMFYNWLTLEIAFTGWRPLWHRSAPSTAPLAPFRAIYRTADTVPCWLHTAATVPRRINALTTPFRTPAAPLTPLPVLFRTTAALPQSFRVIYDTIRATLLT
jgi:hypothetical protein